LARPWTKLASVATPEGPLELQRRGEKDFLILINGRVLMTSGAHRSEDALAKLACAELQGRARPRILLSGLGMGFTLRAALDELADDADVTVAELNPVVVEWCKGPLAAATNNALGDPRVKLEVADVAQRIANSKNTFDAILLDLYEGPNAASQRKDDPFYSALALMRTRAALRKGGVLAVWSEDADAPFAKRFVTAGFVVKHHSIGAGGRKHAVYVGKRT